MRLSRRRTPVHTVTEARRPRSHDIRYRERRYLISMGVRTACFLLAVVLTGPARWIAAGGAIVLPYVAVVFANGGREPEPSARFAEYGQVSGDREAIDPHRPEIGM